MNWFFKKDKKKRELFQRLCALKRGNKILVRYCNFVSEVEIINVLPEEKKVAFLLPLLKDDGTVYNRITVAPFEFKIDKQFDYFEDFLLLNP